MIRRRNKNDPPALRNRIVRSPKAGEASAPERGMCISSHIYSMILRKAIRLFCCAPPGPTHLSAGLPKNRRSVGCPPGRPAREAGVASGATKMIRRRNKNDPPGLRNRIVRSQRDGEASTAKCEMCISAHIFSMILRKAIRLFCCAPPGPTHPSAYLPKNRRPVGRPPGRPAPGGRVRPRAQQK